MNVSRIFIERPVATTVLFASILIFGWLGFTTLPVNDLPNVDFPTITVTARLPGANPEVMANTVALPLEREFSRISGVDEMTSIIRPTAIRASRCTFSPEARYRFGSAGRADGDLAGHPPPAGRHARSADAAQAQSGRCAGPDPRASRRSMCRCRSWTSSPTTQYRAALFHGERRRAGAGVRLAEIRRARCSWIRTRWSSADWGSTRW